MNKYVRLKRVLTKLKKQRVVLLEEQTTKSFLGKGLIKQELKGLDFALNLISAEIENEDCEMKIIETAKGNPITKRKVKLYSCDYCGSTDLNIEALVKQNESRGALEVIEIMDKGHSCNSCGKET